MAGARGSRQSGTLRSAGHHTAAFCSHAPAICDDAPGCRPPGPLGRVPPVRTPGPRLPGMSPSHPRPTLISGGLPTGAKARAAGRARVKVRATTTAHSLPILNPRLSGPKRLVPVPRTVRVLPAVIFFHRPECSRLFIYNFCFLLFFRSRAKKARVASSRATVQGERHPRVTRRKEEYFSSSPKMAATALRARLTSGE